MSNLYFSCGKQFHALNKESQIKLLGMAAIVFMATGIVFKNLHMGGANLLQVLGFILFSGGFAPLHLKVKLREETRREGRIAYASLFIVSVLMMISALFIILELPYRGPINYLSLIVFMVYIVFFSRGNEERKLKLRKDRQLATILFTDIVGYTRLMSENEDQALEILDHNRKTHTKWIAKYRGSLLKEMGDGTFSIFYTASEAVLCAREIMNETNHANYQVRMGIHIAEIVFTDTDAFGDGVNLTSRICGLAKGGEICFTEGVYQNIRNREQLTIENLGFTLLKNVPYPVLIYKIGTETLIEKI